MDGNCRDNYIFLDHLARGYRDIFLGENSEKLSNLLLSFFSTVLSLCRERC